MLSSDCCAGLPGKIISSPLLQFYIYRCYFYQLLFHFCYFDFRQKVALASWYHGATPEERQRFAVPVPTDTGSWHRKRSSRERNRWGGVCTSVRRTNKNVCVLLLNTSCWSTRTGLIRFCSSPVAIWTDRIRTRVERRDRVTLWRLARSIRTTETEMRFRSYNSMIVNNTSI